MDRIMIALFSDLLQNCCLLTTRNYLNFISEPFQMPPLYEEKRDSIHDFFFHLILLIDRQKNFIISTYQQTLQHITTRIKMMIRAMNPINATTRRNQTVNIAYNTVTDCTYNIQHINRPCI